MRCPNPGLYNGSKAHGLPSGTYVFFSVLRRRLFPCRNRVCPLFSEHRPHPKGGCWGPRTRPLRLAGAREGGPPGNGEGGEQRDEQRARRSNSRCLLLTGEPHPLRHQRRPANGRAGKAGLTSKGPRGGATRGGRDVEGGQHLTDSSLKPILCETSPLSSLLGSVRRPTFSSSTPPHSFASRPASPPPLCGQITAGKRRGPKRQARVEP